MEADFEFCLEDLGSNPGPGEIFVQIKISSPQFNVGLEHSSAALQCSISVVRE